MEKEECFMIKFDVKKLVPVATMLVGVGYSLLTSKNNEMELDKKVEEKVAKALAEMKKD